MSIEVAGGTVRIIGNATVEDAEPLLAALLDDPARTVDLDQATHLHSAVIQLLLAVRPTIAGAPAHPFFATWITPLLDHGPGTA
jgi:hypothetical protein